MLDPGSWSRGRILLTLLTVAMVALPFLVVDHAPVTDLGQHSAQIRLFLEALEPSDTLYEIQWLTPYATAYLAVGLGWLVAGPLAAGRLGLMLLAIAWVVALHALSARRGRSAAAATLASLLVFNHVLYWGFLGFIAGFPMYVVWWLWCLREAPQEHPWREAVITAGLAFVLYLTHALWFAAGMLTLAVVTLARRRRWRQLATRWLAVLPTLLLALSWYRGLSGTTFSTPALWARPLSVRLSPREWVDAAFGGLHGPLEPLALAVLAAWLGAGLWGHRDALRRHLDRPLAATAGAFLAAAVILPDKLTNTIEFNDRWMPVGLALLVLALPAPRLPRDWHRAVAVIALVVFGLVTAATWHQVERVHLTGFDEAMERLPPEPLLMGLDFSRASPRVKQPVFFQMYAFGQALRGGRLNFSFAEFAPSLVVYEQQGRPLWTPGLEWFPDRVRRGDLGWFDHLLVHGPPQIHAGLAADPALEPLHPGGEWGLYRIDGDRLRGAPAPAAPAPLRPTPDQTPR